MGRKERKRRKRMLKLAEQRRQLADIERRRVRKKWSPSEEQVKAMSGALMNLGVASAGFLGYLTWEVARKAAAAQSLSAVTGQSLIDIGLVLFNTVILFGTGLKLLR